MAIVVDADRMDVCMAGIGCGGYLHVVQTGAACVAVQDADSCPARYFSLPFGLDDHVEEGRRGPQVVNAPGSSRSCGGGPEGTVPQVEGGIVVVDGITDAAIGAVGGGLNETVEHGDG